MSKDKEVSDKKRAFNFANKEQLWTQQSILEALKRYSREWGKYGIKPVDIDHLTKFLNESKKNLTRQRERAVKAKAAYEKASGKTVRAGWDRNK